MILSGFMFEPVVKSSSVSSSSLVFGNPESNVAIVTLWSKVSWIAEKVDKSKYAVMGQLFSAERGLDPLIRNLLANPHITNIIITGVDFSKSGIVLKDFFEKGFFKGKTELTGKECWRVDSAYPGYIGPDIPENVLNELRETVKVKWVHKIEEFDPASLEVPEKKRGRHEFVKKEEEIKENKYVGEDAVYVVRGKTIAEVWLKILDTIMKFGKEDATHYDEYQKEILNLVSVITGEDPDSLFIPEFLPFDAKHIMNYIPQITTGAKVPGTAYTYGMRIRSWFGTDQVEGAVQKLAQKTISRAVVINLWDSTKDLTIGGSPCINHIWLRVRDGRLYMTATIRSNDMFEAYPDNAFGLRALQEIIRKEVNKRLKEKDANAQEIRLGDMIINSQSAHIYRDCWERAQAVLDRYLDRYVSGQTNVTLNPDPRGNFVIGPYQGNIVVHHLSNTNEVIGTYTGKTAEEVIEKMAKQNIISVMGHALDIGKELEKAEIAMRLGIPYSQDSPLDITGVMNKKSDL